MTSSAERYRTYTLLTINNSTLFTINGAKPLKTAGSLNNRGDAVNLSSSNRLPGIRVTKRLSQTKRFEIGGNIRRADPAMNDIVLSAGVRQNLLALQSTHSLM